MVIGVINCDNCLHTEVCGNKAAYIEAVGTIDRAKPEKLPKFVKIKADCVNYKGKPPQHPISPLAQQLQNMQLYQNRR